MYAAGWDPANTVVCDGFTLESQAQTDTPLIQADKNRALVFLIETSDMKKPNADTWGQIDHVSIS